MATRLADRPLIVKFILAAVAYFAAAKLSLTISIPRINASAIWPPAAIGLCICLVWGERLAPAIWLGSTLATFTLGTSIVPAAIVGTGNMLESLTAVILIRHFVGTPSRLFCVDNVFKFVAIAMASSLIPAFIGVVAMAMRYDAGSVDIVRHWLTWWLGDTTGIIIVAPLLLTWNMRQTEARSRWRTVEAGVFAVLLVATASVVFDEHSNLRAVPYTTLVFIIWAAFRYGMPGVARTVATLAAIAIWKSIAQRHGVFSIYELNESLLFLQAFLSIIAITGILQAASLEQRALAERDLRRERDLLDKRVQDRTADLERNVQEIERLKQSVEKRESQLAEAQRLTLLGSWEWEIATNTVSWSDELYRIFELDKKQAPATHEQYLQFIHPDDQEMVRTAIRIALQTRQPYAATYRIITPTGAVKILQSRGNVTADENGMATTLIGTAQDVTEQTVMENRRRDAERRYRKVVELSPNGIFVIDASGKCLFANLAALTLCGADTPDQVIGKSAFRFLDSRFCELLHPDTPHANGNHGKLAFEGKFNRLDGSAIDVEMKAANFGANGDIEQLIIVHDVTERKEAASRIQFLAEHDFLTRLPSRALLLDRLEQGIAFAKRNSTQLAVLFIDLDHFKNINDSLGHNIGDKLLQEVAMRLQGCVRSVDTISRQGGDEFVILLVGIGGLEQAAHIADNLMHSIAAPYRIDSYEISITSSIGVSMFPDDGTDIDTLIKNADLAMYYAKERGRNSYQFFSQEMNLRVAQRLTLENSLRRALDRNEFVLHYQPQVSLASGRMVGAEALIRWQHPELGMLLPQHFISVAEECGLIASIGNWVLQTACVQAKSWQGRGRHIAVSVNVSMAQFRRDDLVKNVSHALNISKLEPQYLELEITESVLADEVHDTVGTLSALRKLGVRVSIDDFGTGYSSLSYLKRFTIDKLKIDQSFVRDVPADESSAEITSAIIAMAKNLRLKVIAEGVETQEQFRFLEANGCDEFQGYYLSKALPATDFAELTTP